MLNFELTEDQLELQAKARKFAREEVAPKCKEWVHEEYFPYDLNDRVAELGFTGIMIPKEYGGAGKGVMSQEVVTEELSRIDDGVACALHMQGLVADMIVQFGTEEQKQELLPGIIKGENPGFALTEPDAGSDTGGILTTAELKNGEWVLNGNKIFITNAGLHTCKWIVVMCATGVREGGKKEFSSIIVPSGTPGYTVGQKFTKIGWKNVDNHELVFENCRVPEENLLGKRGRGVAQALYTLDLGRIDFGALTIGMAQGAFDLALEHAKNRKQFGRSLGDFQTIQFKLAEMRTKIEVGRNMYYKSAWMRDNGKPHTLEAAITKLYTSDIAVEVIEDAFKMFGGSGLTLENPITRYLRNIKIYPIGEGTNEIQKIVIARAIGV